MLQWKRYAFINSEQDTGLRCTREWPQMCSVRRTPATIYNTYSSATEAHVSVYVHRYLHIEHINSFKGTDMKWEPSVFGMLTHTLLSTGGFALGCVLCGTAWQHWTGPWNKHTSICMRRIVAGLSSVLSLKIRIHLLSGQGQLLSLRQLYHFLLTGYGLCFCSDLHHVTGQIHPANLWTFTWGAGPRLQVRFPPWPCGGRSRVLLTRDHQDLWWRENWSSHLSRHQLYNLRVGQKELIVTN